MHYTKRYSLLHRMRFSRKLQRLCVGLWVLPKHRWPTHSIRLKPSWTLMEDRSCCSCATDVLLSPHSPCRYCVWIRVRASDPTEGPPVKTPLGSLMDEIMGFWAYTHYHWRTGDHTDKQFYAVFQQIWIAVLHVVNTELELNILHITWGDKHSLR